MVLIRQLQVVLERIYNEVTELHHNREIWQYFNEELPKHGGGIVQSALTRWYIDSQAAGVRRLAAVRSQDKRSLSMLLKTIQSNLSLFAPVKNGIKVTEQSITHDLSLLDNKTASITRWADEQIAHMGRTQTANPTFNDLDEAIDVIGQLLQKYYQLIDGGYLIDVKPVIADDWRQPFRTKWL